MADSQNGFNDDFSVIVQGDMKTRSMALLWNILKKSLKNVHYKFKNRYVTKMGIMKNDHLSKLYDNSKEILSSLFQVNECLMYCCYTNKKDFTNVMCNGVPIMKYETGIKGFFFDLHPDVLMEEIKDSTQNCWLVMFKCCVSDIGHLWDHNLMDVVLSKNVNHNLGELPTNMIITEKLNITLGSGHLCQCFPFGYMEFARRNDTAPKNVHLLFNSVSPKPMDQSYVSKFGTSIEKVLNEKSQRTYIEFIILCANLREFLKNMKMMYSQLLGKVSFLGLLDHLSQDNFSNASHCDFNAPQPFVHGSNAIEVTFANEDIPVERVQNVTETYILVEPEDITSSKNVAGANALNNIQINNQNTTETRTIVLQNHSTQNNQVIDLSEDVNFLTSNDIGINGSENMSQPPMDVNCSPLSDNTTIYSDISSSETSTHPPSQLNAVDGVDADERTSVEGQQLRSINDITHDIGTNDCDNISQQQQDSPNVTCSLQNSHTDIYSDISSSEMSTPQLDAVDNNDADAIISVQDQQLELINDIAHTKEQTASNISSENQMECELSVPENVAMRNDNLNKNGPSECMAWSQSPRCESEVDTTVTASEGDDTLSCCDSSDIHLVEVQAEMSHSCINASNNEAPKDDTPRSDEAMDCTEPLTVDPIEPPCKEPTKILPNNESEENLNVDSIREVENILTDDTVREEANSCQDANDVEMEVFELNDKNDAGEIDKMIRTEEHEQIDDFSDSFSPGRLVIDFDHEFEETILQNNDSPVVHNQMSFGNWNDVCNNLPKENETLVVETIVETRSSNEIETINDFVDVTSFSYDDLENVSPISFDNVENVSPILYDNLEIVSPISFDNVEIVSPISFDNVENVSPILYDNLENVSPISFNNVENISPANVEAEKIIVDEIIHKSRKLFNDNLEGLLKSKETTSIEPNLSAANISLKSKKNLNRKNDAFADDEKKNQLKMSPLEIFDDSIGHRVTRDKQECFERPVRKSREREVSRNSPSKNKKDLEAIKSKEKSNDKSAKKGQSRTGKEVKETTKRRASIETYRIPKKAKLDYTNDTTKMNNTVEPKKNYDSQIIKSNSSSKNNRSKERTKYINNFKAQNDSQVKSVEDIKDDHDNIKSSKTSKGSLVHHESVEHLKDDVVNLKPLECLKDEVVNVNPVVHTNHSSLLYPEVPMEFSSDHDSISEFINIIHTCKVKNLLPVCSKVQKEILELYTSVKQNCEELELERPSLRLLKFDNLDDDIVMHYGILRLLRKKLNDALTETDLKLCDVNMFYTLPKSLRFSEEEKFESVEGSCMVFKSDAVINHKQLNLLKVLKNKINCVNGYLANLKKLQKNEEYTKYFSIRGDLHRSRSLVLHQLCCTDRHSAAAALKNISQQLHWNGHLAELLFKSQSNQKLEFLKDIEIETKIFTECSAYLKKLTSKYSFDIKDVIKNVALVFEERLADPLSQ